MDYSIERLDLRGPSVHGAGLFELYQSVTAAYPGGVYWYHGDSQESWRNVFLCLCGGRLIGKSQVMVYDEQKSDSPETAEHKIYMTVRVLPEYEGETEVFDLLYEAAYKRALELKRKFPCIRPCQFKMGNMDNETVYNQFCVKKGFRQHNDIYHMTLSLEENHVGAAAGKQQVEEIGYRRFFLCNQDEKNRFLALEQKCFCGDDVMSPQRLECLLDSDWVAAFCAEKDGELVGAVFSECDGGPVMVEDLMVHPAFRRNGIARNLLDMVISEAKKAGMEEIKLSVFTHNEEALRVYTSAGFSVEALERRFVMYI